MLPNGWTVKRLTETLRASGIDPDGYGEERVAIITGTKLEHDIIETMPAPDRMHEECDPEEWRATHSILTPNGPKEV